MIDSTCPRCGFVHRAPAPVTIFACCPSGQDPVIDTSRKQVIRIDQPASAQRHRADRPGDRLQLMIKHHFGIDPAPNCTCRQLQREMNAAGWRICLEQIEPLAEKLEANAKEYNWMVTVGAVLRAARTGAIVWLNPLDPWRSLIREACKRTQEDCQTADIGRADWWGAET